MRRAVLGKDKPIMKGMALMDKAEATTSIEHFRETIVPGTIMSLPREVASSLLGDRLASPFMQVPRQVHRHAALEDDCEAPSGPGLQVALPDAEDASCVFIKVIDLFPRRGRFLPTSGGGGGSSAGISLDEVAVTFHKCYSVDGSGALVDGSTNIADGLMSKISLISLLPLARHRAKVLGWQKPPRL